MAAAVPNVLFSADLPQKSNYIIYGFVSAWSRMRGSEMDEEEEAETYDDFNCE